MTTRKVSIDLSLRDNFQSLPFLGSHLDPAVDTRRQPILPKVVWALNVLASEQGVRAASFAQESLIPITVPVNLNTPLFRQVEVIDSAGNISYMLMDDTLGPSGTRIYYLLTSDKLWTRFVSDSVPTALYFPVKHTMFQTRTFVLWTGGDSIDPAWTTTGFTPFNSFLEFNLVDKSVVFHPITGWEQWNTTWIGVASWGNYMLVYTLDRVFYSSPLDFKDFTPAEGLGGSLRISEALGPIQMIVPNSRGFMIYCRKNIVHAEYSGDPVAPFILTEVPNSAGLILFEGEPLVTRNEQANYQVALTSEGLMFVSSNNCEPAPPGLQNVVNQEFVEHKEVDGAKITRHFYPDSELTQYRYNKLKRLELFGTRLFLMFGDLAPIAGNENYNRLLVYDLQTQETVWVEGDIISVVPNLNIQKNITTGRDFQNKIPTIVDSYLLTKRVVLAGQAVYKNIILDFANGTSTNTLPAVPYNFRKAELMFSELSLKRGMLTELYAVKPRGRISTADEDLETDAATRAELLVFSELDDYTTPQVFTWVEESKSFVGFAVGARLRVIFRGNYFDLHELEFAVASGGEA